MFNILFLFRSIMGFRERERYSLFLVLLFSSFSIPFSLKLPFVLCVMPNWKSRVLWPRGSEGCRGDRKHRGPLCGRLPCHHWRLTFLKEREELPLVTVLVSVACFRAATCTGLHETRRFNILPLITQSCRGVKIGDCVRGLATGVGTQGQEECYSVSSLWI